MQTPSAPGSREPRLHGAPTCDRARAAPYGVHGFHPPRPSRPQVRFVPPSPFPAFPAPGSAPARPSVRPAPGLAPRCPPLAPSCPPDSPSPAVSAPGGLTSTARGRVEGAEEGPGAPPRAQLAHPESPRPSGFSSPRARPHRAPERRPCSALYGLGGLQTFGLQRAVGLRA